MTEPMTPERARYLLDHRTTMRSPTVDWTVRTIECSDIRKHMTSDEVKEVNDYWRALPGTASFYTTLLRMTV